MTMFTAVFGDVAVSAAQDLFEIVAPSDARLLIHEIDIGQYSDPAPEADAEILGLSVHRGHTTSGSGGSTVTPVNLDPYSRDAGATVEINNDTVATTSGTLVWSTTWHTQAGFIWRPAYDEVDRRQRLILVKPSQRLVVRITAPADAITTNGSILFEEIGVAPV